MCAFCLAGFALWTVLVLYSHAITPLDEYVHTLASKGATCRPWISINEGCSFLGYGSLVYLLCSLLAGYLVLQGRIKEAIWLAATLVIGLELNHTLKACLSRPRPPVFLAQHHLRSFSYPSGHAFCGLFFYGIALWILRQVNMRCIRTRWATWLVLSLIFLIGESRVALGVHWISDMIGGFMAGLVWLTFNIMLAEKLQFFKKRSNNNSKTAAPLHS